MWWLAGTAGWVYTMVVLGGITRLTRSGLSMTDWKFTGVACCWRLVCTPDAPSSPMYHTAWYRFVQVSDPP
jgi:hypothetical protein